MRLTSSDAICHAATADPGGRERFFSPRTVNGSPNLRHTLPRAQIIGHLGFKAGEGAPPQRLSVKKGAS